VVVHLHIANLVDGALVDDVQLPVEGRFIKAFIKRLKEQLAHLRLTGPGGLSQRTVVSGHVTPTDDLHLFFGKYPLKDMAGAVAFRCFRRGKDHGNAVPPRFRQLKAKLCTDLAQKGIRHLYQNAGAVTGIGFAADSATVVQVKQNGQGLFQYLVGFFPFDVGHKTDTAGIMLELGIV